eukprot:763287-Hanusia_phi.AAC.1
MEQDTESEYPRYMEDPPSYTQVREKIYDVPSLMKALNGTKSLILTDQTPETRMRMIQDAFANSSEMSSSEDFFLSGKKKLRCFLADSSCSVLTSPQQTFDPHALCRREDRKQQ